MGFQAIHSLLSTQLFFCNPKEDTRNVELTECDCVPIKFYLWTHKWEFHVIFMSCDIVLDCFELLTNIILSSRGVQKEAVGWQVPAIICVVRVLKIFLYQEMCNAVSLSLV